MFQKKEVSYVKLIIFSFFFLFFSFEEKVIVFGFIMFLQLLKCFGLRKFENSRDENVNKKYDSLHLLVLFVHSNKNEQEVTFI